MSCEKVMLEFVVEVVIQLTGGVADSLEAGLVEAASEFGIGRDELQKRASSGYIHIVMIDRSQAEAFAARVRSLPNVRAAYVKPTDALP